MSNFYLFFSVTILMLSAHHIYSRKKDVFCISNVVVFIFNIIFIGAPLIIPENTIVENNKLLFPIFFGFLIMLVIFNKNAKPKKDLKRVNISLKFQLKLLNLILVFFVIQFVIHVVSGSYNNILTGNRGDQRLESYYNFSFNFIDVLKSYIVYMFYIIAALCGRDKKGLRRILIGFVLISANTIATSQHRSPVIIPLILMVLFVHIYIRKIKPVYFGVLAFVVIVFMSYSAYIRAGDLSRLASKMTVEQRVAHGIRGLNTSETFSEMQIMMEKGTLEMEYGYQIWLSFMTPIPRVIWQDKPNVSFSSRMTEKMYGRIAPGNWIRTFTVWGEGYAQFGFFGILLYSFILAFGLKKLVYFFSGYIGMEVMLLNFIITLPQLIRTDLFAVYTRVLTLLIVLLLVNVLFGFKKTRNNNNIYINLIK